MLTCVYHPIDDFRVVEDDEADRLKASGVWFDSPTKAREYRLKVEDEIKQESKVEELEEEKPKVVQSKAKLKGKSNER
jgi:hypothetical protein